jgi:hypothetical protein
MSARELAHQVSPLSYLDPGGRRLLDCRNCGQAAKVELHGDRVRATCFAGCKQDLALAGYDVERLRAECRGPVTFWAASRDGQPTGEPVPTGTPRLSLVAASELRAGAPPEPPWLWRGYVAERSVTLVAGKPKSGKSTLLCALLDAVTNGAGSFLGREVRGGAAVLLSEEGAGTLVHKLPESDRLHVLTRERAPWPKPGWAELVMAATEAARDRGAGLLVLDSLSFWTRLSEGQAKDAGVMQGVMDRLALATRAGLAVVLVHHHRKSGGESGDAVRDSSAILGAIDMLLEIERLGDEAPPTYRRLVTMGRWPADTVLVAERDPATGVWRVVGEAADRAATVELGYRERILRALPKEPPGATEAELVDLVALDKRKLSGPLRELLEAGLAERTGEGVKGDPYRYSGPGEKVPPKAAPGAGQNPREGGDSILPLPYRGAESESASSLSVAAAGGQKGRNGEPSLPPGRTAAGLELERHAVAGASDDTSKFIRGETNVLGEPAEWSEGAAADFITRAVEVFDDRGPGPGPVLVVGDPPPFDMNRWLAEHPEVANLTRCHGTTARGEHCTHKRRPGSRYCGVHGKGSA